MSKIAKLAGRSADFARSRIGALLLLTLGCLICAAAFKPYVNSVTITDDGVSQTYITLRSNPNEIMSTYSYALDGADSYEIFAGDNETEINILREFDVSINDAGYCVTVQMSKGTVADALAVADIALPDEDDVISASLSENVYACMEIKLDRVSVEEITEHKITPYKTVKRETAELKKGETEVTQKGVDGEKKVTVRREYKNGELVSEDVISETVTREMVSEVVYVGTAAQTETRSTVAANSSLSTLGSSNTSATGGSFTDSNGRSVSYTKVLTGSGTAYTAESGAKTASGRVVELGVVAVNPDVIPLGTRLYIVSADGKYVYGYALAADTGKALRKGDAIVDVFYETESQCRAFGRRDVVVYVLD